MFSIIISEKGGAEKRQLFDQIEVTVGRVQGNDLVLPKGNVSKRHCRVELVDGRFVVTDQNSTNGTYLNRRRIAQSTVVRQGDRIYIGDFVLRIEDGAVEGAVAPSVSPPPSQPPAQATPQVAAPPAAELAAAVAAPVGPPYPRDPAPTAESQASRPRSGGTLGLPRPSISTTTTGAAMSTDEISMDTTSPRTSPRSESEDARASFISAVAFVVERVCAQLSPAELGSPNAARRVDPLIESLLRELKQNPGVTQPGGAERVRDLARAELLDTGPLAELLDDPSVSEISASGAGYVAVVRGLQRVEVPIPFCAAGSLDRAVERLCAQEGVPLKPAERMAQRVLASSGFELHVMRGDLSPQGAVVHLRRRDGVSSTLEDLVRQGTVSRTVANFLQQCAMGGANMLVVGKARSGATEVLSALASAVPGERTLVLADDRDLADGASRAMAIQQGRGVELAPLFSTIANLPGHRLVVDGLLRADRALALVRAGLEGAEGMAAGLRARSIERGIGQICSQIAIANSGMSVAGVADAIVATFDLALEVARLPDGRSRVVRVAELGRGDATPVAAYDVFRFTVERIATGGAVEGSFSPTGRRPAFAEELQSRGARMDTGMFGRASRAPYP